MEGTRGRMIAEEEEEEKEGKKEEEGGRKGVYVQVQIREATLHNVRLGW